MPCSVAYKFTGLSKKCTASIFRVEKQDKETTGKKQQDYFEFCSLNTSCWLHVRLYFDPEDEDGMFLRNLGELTLQKIALFLLTAKTTSNPTT
jgi:hypothetical protein